MQFYLLGQFCAQVNLHGANMLSCTNSLNHRSDRGEAPKKHLICPKLYEARVKYDIVVSVCCSLREHLRSGKACAREVTRQTTVTYKSKSCTGLVPSPSGLLKFEPPILRCARSAGFEVTVARQINCRAIGTSGRDYNTRAVVLNPTTGKQ